MTKVTVANAEVKLSNTTASAKIVVSGPTTANHEKRRLVDAIATPPIIKPRTIPNLALKTPARREKIIVTHHPTNLE